MQVIKGGHKEGRREIMTNDCHTLARRRVRLFVGHLIREFSGFLRNTLLHLMADGIGGYDLKVVELYKSSFDYYQYYHN